MSTTTYLDVTLLSTSQAAKETTVNTALEKICTVEAGYVTHDMASDADYTLTEAQAEYFAVRITDTAPAVLTTGRNIVVPATHQFRLCYNATAQTLTFKTAAGTGVALSAGTRATLYVDGTNVVAPDAIGVPVGTVEWGDIGGTLANQTDLDGALSGKADTGHDHDLVYAAIGHDHDLDYAPLAQPYDVGGTYNGEPTASLVLLRFPIPRAVVFPASLTGSKGVAGVAATAQTDFDIQKGGASFGTMRFAAAGTTATFISAAGATFAAGDVLTVVAPASPDATLADIGFALVGER